MRYFQFAPGRWLTIGFYFLAYDECQNDDDCKNGGIHGLCLGKDVSQQCKTHCVPTKRKYQNLEYNAH